MQLKNLVYALRQHLADQLGTKPSVGHTYELLASLMGYDSYASLNSQAFLALLSGSHWNVIENVRLLIAGHPDRDRAAQRHAELKSAGDSWDVATALQTYAQQQELVAIPFDTLIENFGREIPVDQWSRFALDELMAGLNSIQQSQLELTLGMLEAACANNGKLHRPLLQLYQRLLESFANDHILAQPVRERVEFHKRSISVAGNGDVLESEPLEFVDAAATPSIDLWDTSYRSPSAAIAYTSEEHRSFAVTQVLKIISPQSPHTIWATHDGTLDHLVEVGFTNVSLSLHPNSRIGRTCLNPFGNYPGSNADQEHHSGVARILHLMMCVVDPDFSIRDQQLLRIIQEAVSDFYRDRERYAVSDEPTLRDFIRSLEMFVWKGFEGGVIAEALAPFYGGGRYAALFNGPFSLGTESDLVLFDMKALEGSPALAPAMLCLAIRLEEKCRTSIKHADKKVLLLAHRWMEHSDIGFTGPFSQLYKSYRRYNLCVLALCESFSKYLSLQDGHPDIELDDGLLMNTGHSFVVNTNEQGPVLEHASFEYSRHL
ncbi:hypothetical protein H8F21_15885 [Pseudomonas sp. P66]|uniref:Uncharacterized protein n=1 Tax=Pseudomonas arcuscaelestis TaxID=2710591 RepID=A0ABS2C1W0_9PSED|nr:hypothetical protein [Pseudomonas arcuscaelestis]MBM5459049.1 hypothetical protein [Pseudomonas arcuscaelestis]